ncbi:RNA polymerase sigma factor [Haliangium sp.]|uniref:RNA polymerase sigma factor n=1 Tax=Haliangium sp. TaxID=2663208 RepID=UPI003D0FD6C9
MPSSDAELLERWGRADNAAGEELFQRYFLMVERFFLNKVSDGVDDMVQETFLACVKGRERLKEHDKFRAYLFAVAYNVLRTHLRDKYRNGQRLDLEVVAACDLSPSPTSLIARQDEQRLLLEALRHIPLKYQILLELHYWEEMTTEEIAQVQGLPVGTVRGRLQRARTRLEEAMAALADSPALLESTVTRLADWVDRCRRDMAAALAAEKVF